MRKDTQDKLAKIQELLKKKEELEKQIETLLNPVPSIPLPANFSINEEIVSLLSEKPDEAKSVKEILSILQSKYPAVDRKRVNGALVYLNLRKKKIVRQGYGMYKVAVATQELG